MTNSILQVQGVSRLISSTVVAVEARAVVSLELGGMRSRISSSLAYAQ
ncbi:MAG: hypothetical protein LDL41_23120 [Coleofasciculus sp. S288]|nr:hypothetical protein [Coleofasciculus sp. S288]